MHEDSERQYSAGVVGLPEVRATGTTEEAALEEANRLLREWLSRVRLVPVQVALPKNAELDELSGFVDPNDPEQKEYLEILARFKQEDLEKTLRGPELSSTAP